MRIYTKKGDRGETSLFDGTRVPKEDARVDAYGEVDELSAHVGLARAFADDSGETQLAEALADVQRDLLALGALLADPRRDGEAEPAEGKLALGPEQVGRLEQQIDGWEEELPPLREFILPGGSRCSGALHVARCVARRAERSVAAIVREGAAAHIAVEYLNRLSDHLFVAARVANVRAGHADATW